MHFAQRWKNSVIKVIKKGQDIFVDVFIAALNNNEVNNAANNLFINTFPWFGVALPTKFLGSCEVKP